MTAKEMFEKLGYECIEDEDHFIEYIITWDDWHGKGVLEIVFDYDIKEIQFLCYIKDKEKERVDITLNIEELQAINKQVEELGWK